MTAPDQRRIAAELERLRRDSGDAELDALEAAIYLEDALGVVLPSSLIDHGHLGSTAALTRTLTGLRGDA